MNKKNIMKYFAGILLAISLLSPPIINLTAFAQPEIQQGGPRYPSFTGSVTNGVGTILVRRATSGLASDNTKFSMTVKVSGDSSWYTVNSGELNKQVNTDVSLTFNIPAGGVCRITASSSGGTVSIVSGSIIVVYQGGTATNDVCGAPATPLAAPTLTLSNPTKDSLKANWSAITNASSYTLQYSDNTSFNPCTTYTVTGTSTVLTPLKSGTTYYVKIKANSSSISYSDSSYSDSKLLATKSQPLDQPTIDRVTVIDSGKIIIEYSKDVTFTDKVVIMP